MHPKLPDPLPLHNLTKDERDRSPYDFCDYLISRLRLDGAIVLAALWVLPDTYYRLFRGIEVWDEKRDALKYKGPWPIIAHPPCGPWGYLINNSHESDEHGIRAMEYVHQYGGVVEQPLGSQLFKQYAIRTPRVLMQGESFRLPVGIPVIERLYQYDFGHRALKKTILYWYKPRRIEAWRTLKRR